MSATTEPGRDVPGHVSAAFQPENVAVLCNAQELDKVVAMGPRGAVAVAGLAVTVLLAIWFAFYLFVFLPRGAVG
jgi:hypothetical protein